MLERARHASTRQRSLTLVIFEPSAAPNANLGPAIEWLAQKFWKGPQIFLPLRYASISSAAARVLIDNEWLPSVLQAASYYWIPALQICGLWLPLGSCFVLDRRRYAALIDRTTYMLPLGSCVSR